MHANQQASAQLPPEVFASDTGEVLTMNQYVPAELLVQVLVLILTSLLSPWQMLLFGKLNTLKYVALHDLCSRS
jgi:hypothetical protein